MPLASPPVLLPFYQKINNIIISFDIKQINDVKKLKNIYSKQLFNQLPKFDLSYMKKGFLYLKYVNMRHILMILLINVNEIIYIKFNHNKDVRMVIKQNPDILILKKEYILKNKNEILQIIKFLASKYKINNIESFNFYYFNNIY